MSDMAMSRQPCPNGVAEVRENTAGVCAGKTQNGEG
jgi:hypothetical protein